MKRSKTCQDNNRPDHIQAIDDLNKKSGRDKSELVRMAVDILVERAKVE